MAAVYLAQSGLVFSRAVRPVTVADSPVSVSFDITK